MLQYKRIDVSERNDVNKTSASKECILKTLDLKLKSLFVMDVMIY